MLPLQVRFFGFGGRIPSEDTQLPEPDAFISKLKSY